MRRVRETAKPRLRSSTTDSHGANRVREHRRGGGSGIYAKFIAARSNSSGFTLFEYSTAGKLVELLKQIASSTASAGVLRNPAVAATLQARARDPNVPNDSTRT